MSAQGLQHLVCRGAVDSAFLIRLGQAPNEVIAGFDLDEAEQRMIVELQPRSLMELASGIEAWRRGELAAHRSAAIPELAVLAG